MSSKLLTADALTDLQMSWRRGGEGQDIEPNDKGGALFVEMSKKYNIPISLPIECTLRRIIDGTNGGTSLTSVDCQVYCIGQLCSKKVKFVWTPLCRDGHGKCTLWNPSMYERHAHGGENSCIGKGDHARRCIDDRWRKPPLIGKILYQDATER